MQERSVLGSFGDKLKRERELRGITLEEIAEATKIGTRSLRALEEENFDKLPGGIFNKGFVRAYAKFLGISEEQAVADYMAIAGEPEQKLPAPMNGGVKRYHIGAEPSGLEEGESSDIDVPVQPESSSVSVWRMMAVLILIAAAAFAGYRLYKQRAAITRMSAPSRDFMPASGSVQAASQAPATAATQPPAPSSSAIPEASAATTPSPSAAKPATTSPEMVVKPATEPVRITLLIRGKKDSWISVKADGAKVMEGTLAAAEEKTVTARQELILRTGNAAAIEVLNNGKPLPPLGPEGETRTFTFTPDGLRQ